MQWKSNKLELNTKVSKVLNLRYKHGDKKWSASIINVNFYEKKIVKNIFIVLPMAVELENKSWLVFGGIFPVAERTIK